MGRKNIKNLYAGISNLDELRRAQRKLSVAIEEKAHELSLEYKEFKRIVNPLTYVEMFVERVRRAGSFAGNVLKVFYAVKNAVRPPKNNGSGADSTTNEETANIKSAD